MGQGSRGSIEPLPSGRFRVVVRAGRDPITGKPIKLTETVDTEHEAILVRERLVAQVDAESHPDLAATVAVLLERWMEVADHELSTADTTAGYVRRTINPVFGEMALRQLQHRVDMFDRLYAHLSRCNVLCDGRGNIKCPRATRRGRAVSTDSPHRCEPMAPGSIRRVHSILLASFGYAVAWGWIERNPVEYSHPPKLKRRRARPPQGQQVARLLNLAWETSIELAMFLWLATTTGARRGELTALRWCDVDLRGATIYIRSNYVVRGGKRKLKETKSDSDRRLALDVLTVQMLIDYREQRRLALAPAGLTLAADAFVFSPEPLCSRPWHPDHFTHAYRELTDVLGIAEPLKNLRHFNATQLLAAGVDLRTTAGRLGHGDGGATTLRVYADWMPETDRRAAEQLAADLAALRAAQAGGGADGAKAAGNGSVGDEEVATTAGTEAEGRGNGVGDGAAATLRAAGAAPAAPGVLGAGVSRMGASLLPQVARPIAEVLDPPPTGRITYVQIAAGLRAAIEAGRLDQGALVPTVTELAAWFGVARSTAQRAVSLVAQDGLIARRGHRWVVAPGV